MSSSPGRLSCMIFEGRVRVVDEVSISGTRTIIQSLYSTISKPRLL